MLAWIYFISFYFSRCFFHRTQIYSSTHAPYWIKKTNKSSTLVLLNSIMAAYVGISRCKAWSNHIYRLVGGTYNTLTVSPKKGGFLDMKLNCIWWWGSCSGDLRCVGYTLTAITSRSTLILWGSHLWVRWIGWKIIRI